MRYALIQDEIVFNIIELNPRNENDFPGAVPIPEDVPAGIGDAYREGNFYREGDKLSTMAEQLADMRMALELLGVEQESEARDEQVD